MVGGRVAVWGFRWGSISGLRVPLAWGRGFSTGMGASISRFGGSDWGVGKAVCGFRLGAGFRGSISGLGGVGVQSGVVQLGARGLGVQIGVWGFDLAVWGFRLGGVSGLAGGVQIGVRGFN